MAFAEILIKPMREELTSVGFEELRTSEEVEDFFDNQKGTALGVVNHVSGSAAGVRQAVRKALEHQLRPEKLVTIFAEQDEAAAFSFWNRTRLPAEWPQCLLFKDGEQVEYWAEYAFAGKSVDASAALLTAAFDQHCSPA